MNPPVPPVAGVSKTKTKRGQDISFDDLPGPATRPQTAPSEPNKPMTGGLALVSHALAARGTERLLDPRSVVVPAHHDRLQAAFAEDDADFATLKAEIRTTAGNVQPIKVRPLPEGAGGSVGQEWELVYGARRLHACLALGFQVRANVDASLDTRQAYVAMAAENAGRKDLSAYERGRSYARALEAGLFPSLRALAEALGVDAGNVSKMIRLSTLDERILSAFGDPRRLQQAWASDLHEAWERAQPEVVRALDELAALSQLPDARIVYDAITRAATPRATAGSPVRSEQSYDLALDGGRAGTLTVTRRGAVKISLLPGVVEEDRREGLGKAIEAYLSSRTVPRSQRNRAQRGAVAKATSS